MDIASVAKLMKEFKILHIELDGDNVRTMDLSPLALIPEQPKLPPLPEPSPEIRADEDKKLARADMERLYFMQYQR